MATTGIPTSYVATVKSQDVAEGFGPIVSEVRAPGGIGVSATLGPQSSSPWESEVAYFGGVPSGRISGCTLPDGQRRTDPGFGAQ